MFTALSLATLLLLMATLLPVWRHPHWLVRGLDFPRLQFAIAAALLFCAQLIFLNLETSGGWALIIVTFTCLVWQLWWIVPYTPLWPKEVEGENDNRSIQRLSIMTANVLTPNRNAEKLLRLVREHHPDLLITLESDHWWQERLDTLEADMPHSLKCPLDNLYGMHLYSRLPLEESEVCYLVEDKVPSMHVLIRLSSGDSMRLHFLHPAPPSPTQNPESTERDAELIVVAHSIADTDQPVIVAGDLNDVAWSTTTRLFRKISGLLDPRVGRGMFNTFHADYPFIRWPLDHLFHSTHFRLHGIKRLPAFGSDHFALFTELAYTPDSSTKQQALTAEDDDHALAQSIIEEKNISEYRVPRPGEDST